MSGSADCRCYSLWQSFNKEVDKKLDKFLEDNVGVTSDQVYASVERIQSYDPQFLSCIDYLTAAAEYTEFIKLMLDFKVIQGI